MPLVEGEFGFICGGVWSKDLNWIWYSTFDHLIGIHFGPSIGIFLLVLNWVLGCSSFALELFFGFIPKICSTPHELS